MATCVAVQQHQCWWRTTYCSNYTDAHIVSVTILQTYVLTSTTLLHHSM